MNAARLAGSRTERQVMDKIHLSMVTEPEAAAMAVLTPDSSRDLRSCSSPFEPIQWSVASQCLRPLQRHTGCRRLLGHPFHRGSTGVKTAIAAASGSVDVNNESCGLSLCGPKPARRAAFICRSHCLVRLDGRDSELEFHWDNSKFGTPTIACQVAAPTLPREHIATFAQVPTTPTRQQIFRSSSRFVDFQWHFRDTPIDKHRNLLGISSIIFRVSVVRRRVRAVRLTQAITVKGIGSTTRMSFWRSLNRYPGQFVKRCFSEVIWFAPPNSYGWNSQLYLIFRREFTNNDCAVGWVHNPVNYKPLERLRLENTYKFAGFPKNMPDSKVDGGVDHLRSLAPGLSTAPKLDTAQLDEGISGSAIKVHQDYPAQFPGRLRCSQCIRAGVTDGNQQLSCVCGGPSRSTEITSLSWSSIQINTPPSFLIALQLDTKMELLLDKRPIYFSRTLKLPVHALPIRKLVIARNPIPGCYCLFTLRFTALVDIIEGCSLLL
ncbi:hypothetical protein V8E54_015251 [Elaphomyces granulatus]